jgi:hypothetical protein
MCVNGNNVASPSSMSGSKDSCSHRLEQNLVISGVLRSKYCSTFLCFRSSRMSNHSIRCLPPLYSYPCKVYVAVVENEAHGYLLVQNNRDELILVEQ